MKEVKVLAATPMQQEVLTSNKRVTLLAVGAGAGATYALYLKAITSKGDHVSFVSPTWKLSNLCFDYFCKEFAGKLNARVSKSSQIITIPYGKKIKFTSPKNGLYDLKGLMLVDNAHNFPQDWLDHYIEKTDNEIVFTSKPYECGWRNPLYVRGELQKDENGVILYTDKSWDASLVNWIKQGELGFVGNTAKPIEYKEGVKVIHDYEVRDNQYLVANNPCYIEALDSLPPKDKIPLEGRWVL